MKKSTTIPLISTLMATFILCSNLNAQRLTVGGMSSSVDMVTINNLSARVDNLLVIDSIDQGNSGEKRSYNSKLHLASFEIELGSDEATNMVKTLFSGMGGQALPDLITNKLNLQGQVMERRTFSYVSLKEIVFPEFNTESRDPAKVKVIIQAENVSTDVSPNGTSMQNGERRSKSANSGSFRLVMGDLPTQRVLRISNLRIVANSNQEGVASSKTVGEAGYFNIDVASVDAKKWNDWFNTGGGPGTNKDALIAMLDQNTSTNIFSIQLSDVQILSVSVASNRGSIPKTTIGLKSRNIPILQ